MNPQFWAGRKVFLTGHTGFKGAWLALWLREMGAEVTGYARDPSTHPSLFDILDLPSLLAADHRADLLDLARLAKALEKAAPEVVFHMAAQALVHEGYRDPVETFGTNVMGTMHVLEAARKIQGVRAIVVVTTDKCYEVREPPVPHRETDRLGGADPYSASKACAELVTAACRSSFYAGQPGMAAVATARAGNVIGGGDWAADRLIPDCIRAFTKAQPVVLRRPGAVRPWQHVLEPLAGYLTLAQALAGTDGTSFASSWNFGPDAAGEGTVLQVASLTAKAWSQTASVTPDPGAQSFNETHILRLDSSKARQRLGWKPRWNLEQAIAETARWYRAWHAGEDMSKATSFQIRRYADTAA
jgi:CDP-glucose 4,6-dehydratase